MLLQFYFLSLFNFALFDCYPPFVFDLMAIDLGSDVTSSLP